MAENRFKGAEKKNRFKGAAKADAAYWDSSSQAMDTLTMGGSTKGGAAMTALLDATLNAIKGDGFDYSNQYNENLAALRQAQARYNEESPVMARVGDAGGLLLGAARLPVVAGRGVLGAVATGLGYGAAGGALEDANSLSERATNTLKGGAAGGLIGAGGYGAGKAVAWGLDKAGRAIKNITLPPETRAAGEIAGMADDRFGPNSAMLMDRELARLGPDAVRVDVLGEQGRAAARRAANVNPDARETLETFAQARKANQNARLVADVQAAGGVPKGSRKTVEELQQDAYKAVRPQISAAYDAAREAGKDVPLEFFQDVLNTPVGKAAFEQASENVATRAAIRGEGGGNLAILDETKRILDKKATKAYRESDAMADVYSDLAKHLRSQMDVLLDGNEYAAARGLRQKAYKAEEAFQLGEELGQRNVPMDAPGRAAKVEPDNAKNVAAAYAQTKTQRLLNNNNTEAAMTEFATPSGRAASKAALGQKAADIDAAIEREKLFNALNKALGNSTTTRQLIEAGGAGVAGAGLGGYLSDYDPFTMGVTGVLSALARRTAPKIGQKITSRTQMRVAPETARLLTGKGALPSAQLVGPNVLERLSKVEAEALMKALLLELQKNSPQTNRAQ